MLNGAICYDLDHRCIGDLEIETERPFVDSNGQGVTRVLRWLQANDQAAFESLLSEFKQQFLEVAELTVRLESGHDYRLLVKEKGLNDCWPISELSPGARTVLALLAIVYQPNKPELILLEDIEHSIHPRGIAPLIETIRRISKEHGVQFIMTTQHPYVLDCFRAREHWADVVIVEKKDGVSRLANMDDRLKRLHYEDEMDKVRLSELWYSGLMGGVANPPPAWDKEP